MIENIEKFKEILIHFKSITIEEWKKTEEKDWSIGFNCPLLTHKDKNKNAFINLKEKYFSCDGCFSRFDKPRNLLKNILNTTTMSAFFYMQNIILARPILDNSEERILDLELSEYAMYEKTLKELNAYNKIGNELLSDDKNTLRINVPINKKVIGVMEFMWNETNTKNKLGEKGIIIPFDKWKQSDKTTIIVPTFKDMIIARHFGLNAIYINGGVTETPTALLHEFKNKEVGIIYPPKKEKIDYAMKLAIKLHKTFDVNVKIIKQHFRLLDEKNNSFGDLLEADSSIIEKIELWLLDSIKVNSYIQSATKGLYEAKNLESIIKEQKTDIWYETTFNIESSYDNIYSIPSFVRVYSNVDKSNYKNVKKIKPDRYFKLINTNIDIVAKLISSPEKTKDIILEYFGENTAAKKNAFNIEIIDKITACKADITDNKIKDQQFVTKKYEKIIMATPILAFGLNNYKWENGLNYKGNITLSTLGNRVIAIVKDSVLHDNFIHDFEITNDVKVSLDKFKVNKANGQNLEDKIDELFLRTKHPDFGGVTTKKEYWLVYECAFNTVKQFKYSKSNQLVRGVPYFMIAGASGVGKTAVFKALRKKYRQGNMVDLKNATEIGMVGGIKHTGAGGNKKTLGVIPKENGGLLLIDEAQGDSSEKSSSFRSKISMIKSENWISIVRAVGTIEAEVFVRLIEAANHRKGQPIEAYPNGIEVFKELITSHEEWRRYDAVFLAPDIKKSEYISKGSSFTKGDDYLEPFKDTDYQNRIKWVWSRTPNQIKISEDTRKFIVLQERKLINRFSMSSKIFTTETDDKITRLAIAFAAATANTCQNYENIIVEKTHISFVVNWLTKNYTSKLFNIDNAISQEQKYSVVTEEDKKVFIDSINISQLIPAFDLLMQLDEVIIGTLAAACGKEVSALRISIGKLVSCNLLQTVGTREKYSASLKLKRLYKDWLDKMEEQAKLQQKLEEQEWDQKIKENKEKFKNQNTTDWLEGV